MQYPVTVIALRPSRGLEFSQSTASVDFAFDCANGRVRSGKRLHTWDLKIPDSFNDLVLRFLRYDADYAWFVEEDIVVPGDALCRMLEMEADVTAINYNLKEGGPGRNSEVRTSGGELHTLSTGCMLIKRRVLEEMPAPWFRTDLVPGMRFPGSATPNPYLDLIPNTSEYGGHDGFFTLSAIRAGFKVASVPDARCEHLRMDSFGAAGVNDGCHVISKVE